jgi:DNA repair exonuclease SbcCD ATPase subunit
MAKKRLYLMFLTFLAAGYAYDVSADEQSFNEMINIMKQMQNVIEDVKQTRQEDKELERSEELRRQQVEAAAKEEELRKQREEIAAREAELRKLEEEIAARNELQSQEGHPSSIISPINEVSPEAETNFSAPSFDCTRAYTTVEKMICNSVDISELDGRMAVLYGKVREMNYPDLVSQQKEWLAERNQCDDEECLKLVYIKRIDYLSNLSGSKLVLKENETENFTSCRDVTFFYKGVAMKSSVCKGNDGVWEI